MTRFMVSLALILCGLWWASAGLHVEAARWIAAGAKLAILTAWATAAVTFKTPTKRGESPKDRQSTATK